MKNLKIAFLFVTLSLLVVGLGVFLGDALFGERSYFVLKDLQKEKAFLYKDISRLEDENAKLQKLYLERLSLDPDAKL